MTKFDWKHKVVPHIVAVAVFYIAAICYFAPIFFDNKDLAQGDVVSFLGWGNDVREHYEQTGEVSFWSNAMFGGMPSNYSFGQKTNNLFKPLSRIAEGFLPHLNAGVVFAYMIGFYIFLLAIGCSPWLAIFGALGYAFCSYNIIIIDAGHINKGLVMATIAPIAGGVILCYRKRYAIGALLTLISVGLNVYWNHQQVSFYIILMLMCMAICYLIYAIKEKTFKNYIAASAILLCVAILSATPAVDKLVPTMDFSKETMRGGAVLKADNKGEKENAGLNIDYAYSWSYGKAETMTLLIPNFYGGSSNYDLGNESHFYEALRPTGQASVYVKNSPAYWGDQPFTSGPVYAGAIICFLFILGMLVCKGKERWWILAATVVAIVLSWGRNLPSINNWLFYNLPLYNKFRTPSMSLVIVNFTMAAMAFMCLKEIVNKSIDKKELNKKLYIAFGAVGGICLIFCLFGGTMFSFEGLNDAQLPDWAVSALVDDRKEMLKSDAWRSFVYILLAVAVIWLYNNEVLKKETAVIVIIGMLCFIDVWSVDKRFLNEESFIPARQAKNIQASEIDEAIKQDKDPDYRVLNLTTNTFNESRTSFHHKSIGGYSPVKLRRYQDIIDYHINGKINWPVINMLNTKYVIFNTEKGPMYQMIPDAMGNCWFVEGIEWMQSPDEEIVALGERDLRKVALMDVEWKDQIKDETALQGKDSTAQITLTEYVDPGRLKYHTSANKPQLAVFSEVYYKTWKCYIDGQEAPIERANYILRAVEVPAGEHELFFECIDPLYVQTHKWSLIASCAVGFAMLALMALAIIGKIKTKADETV